MGKCTSTISIDAEVYEAARAANINFSATLEKALRTLTENDSNKLAEHMVALKEQEALLADNLKRCRDYIEAFETQKQKSSDETYATMPELQGMTMTQLEGKNDVLFELIGKLRATYKDRNISILSLEAFLKRRDAEVKAGGPSDAHQ